MSDSKKIFILGCGVMQLPSLRIARDMGWYVAAADGNSDAEGRGLCDRFFHVDLKDTDGLTAAASEVRDEAGLDGVFTAGTDFSLSVALVARALGLPGHSPEAARLATDKVAMRRRFSERNVPSPAFCEVGPDDDAAVLAGLVPGPWVVKPVDSMGARGVKRIDEAVLLEEALQEARGYSRSGRALLETYMEGPEYSVDALVEDGRLIRCGLADRLIFYPPHFIEVGHTIPSGADDETADRLWDVFEKGVKALGLTRGAAKGDVKLTPSGPMIGEIAARLSGGYMSGWTWPAASGIEPTRGGLRLAVGLDAGIGEPTRHLVCAERALISIDGTLRRLDGADEAAGLPGVSEVFLRYGPGDRVVFPRNNVEKAGNVIVTGETAGEADERARRALRSLRLELDPADPATGTYLDGEGPFPPDALVPQGDFRQHLDSLWSMQPPCPSRGRGGRPALVPAVPSSEAADPAGRTAEDILDILVSEGRLRRSEESGDPRFLSDFWKALVRGGLAGARWFLEN